MTNWGGMSVEGRVNTPFRRPISKKQREVEVLANRAARRRRGRRHRPTLREQQRRGHTTGELSERKGRHPSSAKHPGRVYTRSSQGTVPRVPFAELFKPSINDQGIPAHS
jgi:hypothetical protein